MKLTTEQIQVISRTTLEYLEKQKQKQEKMKRDRRLHNIKLLLRNYRTFKRHCGSIKQEIDEIDSKIDLNDIDSDEFKLESIKRSKEKTLAMIRYIDKMIKAYDVLSSQEGDEERRRFKTIYHMYISDNKKTIKEICELHFLSNRAVYYDIDKACETLSVLLFGVEAIEFKK